MSRPDVPSEYAAKKNPLAGNANSAEAGKQVYNVYCTSCHGETGMGDGPAAASLDPTPQPLAKNQTSLSDAYLFWRISEGGLMEPFRSAMPAWKNALDEEQIWEVITYLRTFSP